MAAVFLNRFILLNCPDAPTVEQQAGMAHSLSPRVAAHRSLTDIQSNNQADLKLSVDRRNEETIQIAMAPPPVLRRR